MRCCGPSRQFSWTMRQGGSLLQTDVWWKAPDAILHRDLAVGLGFVALLRCNIIAVIAAVCSRKNTESRQIVEEAGRSSETRKINVDFRLGEATSASVVRVQSCRIWHVSSRQACTRRLC